MKEKEPSLNSRILYNDRFFNQMIQGTSSYETNSGTLPQQEFTLKFQQDKVFTLGTITIPTEFKNYKNLKWLHLSIRQSTLGVLTQSGVYKNTPD
jgi:hypothetical protein